MKFFLNPRSAAYVFGRVLWSFSQTKCETNSLLDMFIKTTWNTKWLLIFRRSVARSRMTKVEPWGIYDSYSADAISRASEHPIFTHIKHLPSARLPRFSIAPSLSLSHSALLLGIVLLQENLYFLSKFIHTQNIWPKMREKFKWKLIF